MNLTDDPGLLTEFRFDQGSGTVLTDYSGNNYNGTLGTAGEAPAWTALGLQFDGGDKVTLPASLAIGAVRTAILYGTMTAVGDNYNVALSSDGASGLSWLINHITGSYKPSPAIWVGGVGLGQTAPEDTFQVTGGQGAAWVQDGIADRLYVNGQPCLNMVAGAGGNQTAATGRVGGLVIGKNPANGALTPYTGTMAGMILSASAYTPDQVLAANAYLAATARARGLTPYASGFTGYRLWAEGDSITAGSAIVTPPTTTAATLYHRSYTTILRAVGGNTICRIAGGIRSRTLQQYAAGAARNILWLWAGTNDIYSTGLTAAVTFQYLDQAVRYAISRGFKVVVAPMISRTNSSSAWPSTDAVKNIYNALIWAAAASWGTSVYVIQASQMAGLIEDGAYAGGNFGDGTHPTQAASDSIIAPAFAAGVNYFD